MIFIMRQINYYCERCELPANGESFLCEDCQTQLKILLDATEQSFREKIPITDCLSRLISSSIFRSEEVKTND